MFTKRIMHRNYYNQEMTTAQLQVELLDENPETSDLCDMLGSMQEQLMPPIDVTTKEILKQAEELEKKLKAWKLEIKKTGNEALSVHIESILRENGGMTAKEIGKILRADGQQVDRKTVNSCLYDQSQLFRAIREGNAAPVWQLCNE